MAKNTPTSFDPERIFLSAAGFEYAEQNLFQNFKDKAEASGERSFGWPVVPWNVLSVFSLELYLKCLIQLETGKTPRGHDIPNLFGQISPARQADIKKAYEVEVAADAIIPLAIAKSGDPHKFDFDRVLQDLDSAFMEWRYYYETEPKTGTEAQMIRRPVKELLLKLHPEWQCILENLYLEGVRTMEEDSPIAISEAPWTIINRKTGKHLTGTNPTQRSDLLLWVFANKDAAEAKIKQLGDDTATLSSFPQPKDFAGFLWVQSGHGVTLVGLVGDMGRTRICPIGEAIKWVSPTKEKWGLP